MAVSIDQIKQRVTFLKVPIDIVPPENLADVVYSMLAEEKEHNIVLLSVWDLLRARRNGEYRTYVTRAAMVIPISKSIVTGVKFLTGKKVYRYKPFDFIISMLTILEKREFSTFLLGGKRKILNIAEKNIRQTFPKLRIVGRCQGNIKKSEEGIVIKAIKKASPSFLMVGKGVRGEEKWIARNNVAIGQQGLRLWVSDIFDVFAEKKKHPSTKIFNAGLEWVGFCFQKPIRFFRLFPFMYFKLLLLCNKLFVKE